MFVPLFAQKGHGHILNVASAAGLLCAPRMAAYNVAKAGSSSVGDARGRAHRLRRRSDGPVPDFFRTNIVAAGHFTDEETRVQANRMMAAGRPVHEVVLAALSAVDRNELYQVPMADGRWLWRPKRASPAY